MDSYSVILKNSNEESSVIQGFLKDYYSFDNEETLAFLKKSPGFLIENVILEKAEEVRKKAQEKNIQTLIIDDKNIPQLPKPMNFVEMEIIDSGFFFISKSIREYVPLESVTMVTTGIIKTDCPETSTDSLSLELHQKTEKLLNLEKTEDLTDGAAYYSKAMKDKKLTNEKQKELIFYMDIFLSEAPHRLRIQHDNFDYSFLGKEKLYSSIENFKLLLNKVNDLSTKPFKNKTIAAILKKEPLIHFIYESLDTYEKELVWLSIINRF